MALCCKVLLQPNNINGTEVYLDDTLDVAMSFGEIFGAEFGGSFAMFSVSLEDSSCSFTLGTNNTTHSGKL